MSKAKKLVQEIISEIISRESCLPNGVDIKSFDSHTFEHSVNVAVLSLIMGVRKRYEKKQLYNLGVAALFHDIGKIFIPEYVLNKKNQLTDKEFDLIKEHPQLGFEYIKEHYLLEFNGFIRMGVKEHKVLFLEI